MHPDTNTGNLGGIAYRNKDQLWYKLPQFTNIPLTWRSPSATTLAHELGHNYGRLHVDCGGPADPDPNYPYPPCILDNPSPAGHYGFDVKTRTAMAPNSAADLMSYGFPKWISDYTWKGIYNSIDNERPAQQSLAMATPAQQELWNAGANSVLLSGIINPENNTAELDYAWQFPPGSISPRVQMKFLETASEQYKAEGSGYHIQLLDSNGSILTDRAITLPIVSDSDDQETGFLLSFPAPVETVASLQLMENTTVLAHIQPGTSIPSVTIQAPSGGESIDNTLNIQWNAVDQDADHLKYSIQYSPDDGLSWITLVSEYVTEDANANLTLENLQDIPGSTTARIRVIASDGYNTAIATSNNFTLVDQKPMAYIAAPAAEQWFDATEIIALRGGATDAEDGALEQYNKKWSIDGITAGYNKTVNLQNYAPGHHTATFEATDSMTNTSVVTRGFNIAPLEIRTRNQTPELDGNCDESVYRFGKQIDMSYNLLFNSNDLSTWLVRTNDALYVCFTGMYTSSDHNSIWLNIDGDHSQDSTPQTGDFRFFINDEGTTSVWQGNGTNFVAYTTPNLYESRLLVEDTSWSAELKIPNVMLGNVNGFTGLQFGYTYAYLLSTSSVMWPRNGTQTNPATWGTTLLGTLPKIETLSQSTEIAGADSAIIVISGKGFTNQSVAYWNDTALDTNYLSSSGLIVTIDANLLSQGGLANITVQNAPTIISNPARFTVFNPTPTIISATPNRLALDTATALSITGEGFTNESTVLWEGESIATTYINSTTLQVIVPAELLIAPHTATIVVTNPEPVEATSNPYALQIASNTLYLPITRK